MSVLIITGCGLPTIPFLAPPLNPGFLGSPPAQAILTFQNNPLNDRDDFEGYDIWYKLYADTESGRTRIQDDENEIETTPRQPGSDRLFRRGFRRAVALTRDGEGELLRFDDRRPHIDIDPTSSAVTFELDLRPPLTPQQSPELTEITITRRVDAQTGLVLGGLRRRHTTDSIADPSDVTEGYPTFWNPSRIQLSHIDIYHQELLGPNDETRDDLRIVLYVLAVGIDRSSASFRPFFSEPVRLEEVLITF